ncbi:AbrB/MazE/SpoVT family DNA-binding domain-containing protein [Cryobacterium tepidiphilum]|jgi:AbrB family looped-hinge helix DNA binding protein|uniref:AbrB/MazE/SpoVT family DNA-binding domain-containing protein n=1 Tax=Cryobacterium tepidiphilum TaxID=2486026 RepID=A0A3M8LCS3_9MICO|nr:AbrB/MazE/SpoVT family DNA-binding domain-containing protein [Cryobacterium tepidiphilum]RNE62288.1 AbrB/MazE/SpoVT family DNA-binding domain-containing protein [Cryobacterium tepidiphilum]
MSGTEPIRVGNKGRIVLPAAIRERRNWAEGTALVAIETERGVILAARSELEQLVREQLAGTDLVADLLAERRAASRREDSA